MRRHDREITDRARILEVMARCDVCRLALNDHGWPYIVPLNFGMEDRGGVLRLYFHSAQEGHKVDLMAQDNRAAFEMDCRHALAYDEARGYCTFYYESVMGRGRIVFLEGAEKQSALEALMRHYHPGREAWFDPSAMPRVLTYALEVEELFCKRKAAKPR